MDNEYSSVFRQRIAISPTSDSGSPFFGAVLCLRCKVTSGGSVLEEIHVAASNIAL